MTVLRNIAAVLLLAVGSFQMVGYAFHNNFLKGLGFVLVASPLPLVFSHFRDLETFACDFAIEVTPDKGEKTQVQITPEIYGRLKGPYNRRNIFGALFSHGTQFQTPKELALRESILQYALCHHGPLPAEFGFSGDVSSARIIVRSKTKNQQRVFTYGVTCDV